MIRLIYSGSVSAELDPQQLAAFLTDNRIRNQRYAMTGVMVLMGPEFLQVIEGSDDKVDRCYSEVVESSTHYKLMLLARQEIKEPIFTGWSLGFVKYGEEPSPLLPSNLSTMDIEQIDPYDINSIRALRVIREFIDGKWHLRIPSNQQGTIMQRIRGL